MLELKRTSGADLSLSGPNLATHAFRAGLVDEVHLFVHPASVGGGKPALPQHRVRRLILGGDEASRGATPDHLHQSITGSDLFA